MPTSINLLPKEKATNKNTQKAVRLLNKIAFAITTVFLLVVIVGAAIYFFTNNRLGDLQSQRDNYVASIQSLQSTETNLVLLKDRLQKAQNTLAIRTVEQSFEKQRSVLERDGDSVVFKSGELDESRSNVEFNVLNSRNLASLISSLIAQNTFNTLIINELSFNQITGYTVQMEVN